MDDEISDSYLQEKRKWFEIARIARNHFIPELPESATECWATA